MRCRQDLLVLGLAALAAVALTIAAPPPPLPVAEEAAGNSKTDFAHMPPAPPSAAPQPTSVLPARPPPPPPLRSHVALVLDEREGVERYSRHADEPRPIASITKLMTALVVLESGQALDEPIEITAADLDGLKRTRSRLPVGSVLTRRDLLAAALAASDNRAAAALARRYPGGRAALVAAMNAKARVLGMSRTRFADPTGLDDDNVSTARELALLVAAAAEWNLIQTLSTQAALRLTDLATGREIAMLNTNRLVRNADWDIAVSKTGYTARAGNCLAMRATISGRPLTIVLLDSWGRLSKYGDAWRLRHWLHRSEQYLALRSAGADIARRH